MLGKKKLNERVLENEKYSIALEFIKSISYEDQVALSSGSKFDDNETCECKKNIKYCSFPRCGK